MDLAGYLRFVAALALVLALIGLVAWLARRFGLAGKLPRASARGRRLGVVEFAAIGPRHRLALIRRDDVEHLVLLGPAGDVVIERAIAAEPPAEPEP